MAVSLPVCLHVCLPSICQLSVCMSVLYLPDFLLNSCYSLDILSVCRYACLSHYLSVSVSVCMYVGRTVCLSVLCLSVCLYVSKFVVCLCPLINFIKTQGS